MEPMFWVLIDDEGLILLQDQQPTHLDAEFLATTIYMGYISMRQAMEGELQTQIQEIILPTSQHLIMIRPLPGETLLVVLFPEDTALGTARLGMKRLWSQLEPRLQQLLSSMKPSLGAEHSTVIPSRDSVREKWESLRSMILERAPDPAFVFKRLALRTGIPEQRLISGDLSAEELHRLESHARTILGLSPNAS